MHRLKIFAFIPIGNGGVQTTNLRRKRKDAWLTTDNAGSQFLAILYHKHTMVWQTADNAIGPVDDQRPAGLLQIL
jgi:hypothetical protein